MITLSQIQAIEKGCEGVTPGPWTVSGTQHPYKDGARSHSEQRISTTWDHPQLKGPQDITRLGIGIGLDGQPPIPMIRIEKRDAEHLARLDPATVLSLCALAKKEILMREALRLIGLEANSNQLSGHKVDAINRIVRAALEE